MLKRRVLWRRQVLILVGELVMQQHVLGTDGLMRHSRVLVNYDADVLAMMREHLRSLMFDLQTLL